MSAKPQSSIEAGELVDLRVTTEVGDLNDNGRRDVTVKAEAANPFGDKPLTAVVGPVDLPDKEAMAAVQTMTGIATKMLLGFIA